MNSTKTSRFAAMIAVVLLALGCLSFAIFAGGNNVPTASAAYWQSIELGTIDKDFEYRDRGPFPYDSIWLLPIPYNDYIDDMAVDEYAPSITVSDNVAPGAPIQITLSKKITPLFKYESYAALIQLPEEIENVTISVKENGNDPWLILDDDNHDIIGDSYHSLEHNMYRIFSSYIDSDINELCYTSIRDWNQSGPLNKVDIVISGTLSRSTTVESLQVKGKFGSGSSGYDIYSAFAEATFETNASPLPSITVNTPSSNKGIKYKGIKLFDCDTNTDGMSSNITWYQPERYDTETRAELYRILGLPSIDFSDDEIFNSQASIVAEKFADMVSEKGKELDPLSDGYKQLMKLLDLVWDKESSFEFDSNTRHELEDGGGYYVFYSELFENQDSLTPGRVIGSPIYTTVGRTEDKVVSEKIPTVSVKKWICDKDWNQLWKEATSQVGEDIYYALDGVIPSNLNDFGTVPYSYAFIDTFDYDKLLIDEDSITVWNGNSEVTNYTTHSISKTDSIGTLKVELADLGAVLGLDFSQKLTVRYKAKLTEQAIIGSAGNPNSVYVEYSASPATDEKNRTFKDIVSVYTFDVLIEKVDNTNTSHTLEGASFSLTRVDAETMEPLSSSIMSTKSGKDGLAKFSGISSTESYDMRHGGKEQFYKLEEIDVPDGFLKADPIYLTVSFDYDTKKLQCNIIDNPGHVSFLDMDESHTCLINMQVQDVPYFLLPLTGLSGNKGLFFLGFGVIAFALFSIVRQKIRRKNETAIHFE